MANCLNLYFSIVGDKRAEANSQILQTENVNSRTENITEVQDLLINEDKVRETIRKKGKPGKSCGHDNVLLKDLSLFGDFAATGLSEIINKCFERSQFPSQWKLSKVRALFKRGNRMGRENHRPISFLGIPSKVLESIICENIETHFTKSHLSSPHQWANKERYSTEPFLLHLTEVEDAISSKDGDTWGELMSYKHAHVANPRLQLENSISLCQKWFPSPYDEMVAAHLRGVWAVSGNDYVEAYASQAVVVQVLPVLYTVAVDLRQFALNADRQLAKVNRGKFGENLEKAAEALMNLFRACVSDTRAPLEKSKKWGMLGIVNQLFKIYFKAIEVGANCSSLAYENPFSLLKCPVSSGLVPFAVDLSRFQWTCPISSELVPFPVDLSHFQ
eukprot:gene16373-7775_t